MIFALLTLLAALSLAAVAGWFSIIGIMSIYAGAAFHALIMGIVLEAGKLITTSWLYRNRNYTDWRLKTPLILFTLILMTVTSIGVFGFLSKSHLEQGASTVDNSAKIERLEQQIVREKSSIADNEKVIGQLDATINSYIGKDRTDRSVSVRRSQDPQRKQLRTDINAAQKLIDQYSDEKLKLTSEVRKLQLDVGPIRYIAELVYGIGNTGQNIESAVRMFTLLIVLTLDPLAIILLIAANHTLMRRQNEKKNDPTPKNTENKVYRDREDNNTPSTNISNIENSKAEKDDVGFSNIDHTETVQKVEYEIEDAVAQTKESNIHPMSPALLSLPPENASIDIKDAESSAAVAGAILPPVSKIDEEKTTTLEMFRSGRISAAPPSIIRQPGYARVEIPRFSHKKTQVNETVFPSPPAPDPIAPPLPPVQETSAEIMVVQDPILRELIGSRPHFIPQKVNEEEKSHQLEKYPTSTSTEEGPIPSTMQSGSENKKAVDAQSKEADASKRHKYPKVLSWLTEFKRA